MLTLRNSPFSTWEATRLPPRAECVDHFVSVLPFGKRLAWRLGSKADNRRLYPEAIEQMRRPTRAAACRQHRRRFCRAGAGHGAGARRAPRDKTAAGSAGEARPRGADGSAGGLAPPLDAPLDLVLLSADQYCLTTAIRSASGRPVACGAVKRRVNVGGLDRLLLGARLAAAAAAAATRQTTTQLVELSKTNPRPSVY